MIEVIINEGGLTCTTVNPLGEKPPVPFTSPALDEWKKSQSERQTFEIENQIKYPYFDEDVFIDRYYFQPGCTYEAEIVNGKALIK